MSVENIINFEYFEHFPISGFTSLIFPIRKALGPLPKIAKKIPGFTFSFDLIWNTSVKVEVSGSFTC